MLISLSLLTTPPLEKQALIQASQSLVHQIMNTGNRSFFVSYLEHSMLLEMDKPNQTWVRYYLQFILPFFLISLLEL